MTRDEAIEAITVMHLLPHSPKPQDNGTMLYAFEVRHGVFMGIPVLTSNTLRKYRFSEGNYDIHI